MNIGVSCHFYEHTSDNHNELLACRQYLVFLDGGSFDLYEFLFLKLIFIKV